MAWIKLVVACLVISGGLIIRLHVSICSTAHRHVGRLSLSLRDVQVHEDGATPVNGRARFENKIATPVSSTPFFTLPFCLDI